MEAYFGLLLYLITFFGGFLLDTPRYINNKGLRNIFVIWLYVFLCFGYMTGSDWRNYEDVFYSWHDVFDKDYGYVYTMNFLHRFIGDFWILFDLFRCLYLWSVILLAKLLTKYWLSSLSFLMQMSLLALTIDTPFRYMIALTLLNFAIIYILKKRYVPAVICCVIAATFHSAIIIVIPFLLLLKTNFFVKTKNWILIALYVAVVVFTASLEKISNLQNLVGLLFTDFGLNSYSSYEAETGVGFFNLGLVLQSIIFLFVVSTKSIVARDTPNGSLITNMAILCFYIKRLGIAIPTGHRFGYLFTLFVAVYLTNLVHIKDYCDIYNTIASYKNIFVRNMKLFFLILVFYYCGTMTKTILNHFVYIPYSNSIPYIVAGHKPYNERFYHNLNAYKQRTGRAYILNSDK